jgi:hypothetical protein
MHIAGIAGSAGVCCALRAPRNDRHERRPPGSPVGATPGGSDSGRQLEAHSTGTARRQRSARSPAMTCNACLFAGRAFDRSSALLRSWPTQLDREEAFCRGSPRRPPRFAWPGAANDPFKLGLSRLNRQLNMLVCSRFVERERRDSNRDLRRDRPDRAFRGCLGIGGDLRREQGSYSVVVRGSVGTAGDSRRRRAGSARDQSSFARPTSTASTSGCEGTLLSGTTCLRRPH